MMTELVWTAKENIAVDLLFRMLETPRLGLDTRGYCELELRIPKIEAVFVYVNEALKEIAKNKAAPYEICYFKRGDYGHYFEPFPKRLSRETVRKAIKKFRLQAARARQLLGLTL